MPKPHGGRLINRVIGEGKDRAEEAKRLPQIVLTKELAKEVQNIAHGVFSPLEGFLTREDYVSVLNERRLTTSVPWTIPIVLDISPNSEVKEGNDAALVDEGRLIAIIHIEDIYQYDKEEMAQKVFGTTDPRHPGVAKVYSMKEFLVGGKIDLIDEPKIPFAEYYLKPQSTRLLFEEKGWRTVVAFQTRNIPHVGHEYLQKTALTFTDGLFINPVIGRKKSGDFKDELILKTYQALIDNYYQKDRVVMSTLPMEMRYAGPREAIFHAIIRKNFGCAHFIVGRDHAGVGNYYPPYAAQEVFKDFPDLDITPMFFKSFAYCKKCLSVVNEKTCPHSSQEHIDFSGTKIREMLLRNEVPPEELVRPEVSKIILGWENPYVD
ncbi:MAG: sulfate adenylyltransferase [Dehalococcoidia bacterium]|nr:MAG: sulfate adenylyltransferase [Dehalococcoidia bacterium]